MKKINIGIQMYSVRDDLAKDFEGTLRKVREMGYDYVEFAGYYGGYTDGKKLKALLDEIGLKSVSVHQGPDMFLEQGQKAYDFFRDYGVKYIVIPWYDGSKLPGNAAWEETKKLFTKISDEAKQNGMSLLYHNHDFEFTKVGDEYQYDIMFRDLNGHLDPEPDTCWMKHGGVNPAEYIRKYGDRINVVHLKDLTYVDGEGKPAYALIGDDGSEHFIRYDRGGIAPRHSEVLGIELGESSPLFDIEISAEKSSPYSRAAQNELALSFFKAGFFDPHKASEALSCLDMMDFDRKAQVIGRIRRDRDAYLRRTLTQMMGTAAAAASDRGSPGNGNVASDERTGHAESTATRNARRNFAVGAEP